MSRMRRYIRSGRPYELEIRVKSGLPFACLALIKLILKSILARTQRDQKVQICHHLWLGNHLHMLFVVYDAEQCVYFYQEVQKKVTECMKRLLGANRLNLWEGDPILAEILDLEMVIKRIAYYYSNPAAANLVDTIDEYPGFSSWQDFLNAETEVNTSTMELVPWIRLPSIPKLPSLKLSDAQDEMICENLKAANKDQHKLELYPYIWLKCFGVESCEEVDSIKKRIISAVRVSEEQARTARVQAGKKVMGAAALKRQAIMHPHKPPPREKRVFVLGSNKEERVYHIGEIKVYDKLCKNNYRAEQSGQPHPPWPPGAIRPHLWPVANAIVDIGTVMRAYA